MRIFDFEDRKIEVSMHTLYGNIEFPTGYTFKCFAFPQAGDLILNHITHCVDTVGNLKYHYPRIILQKTPYKKRISPLDLSVWLHNKVYQCESDYGFYPIEIPSDYEFVRYDFPKAKETVMLPCKSIISWRGKAERPKIILRRVSNA